MRWCFRNTVTPYSEGVLRFLYSDGAAIAPALLLYEVVAVLTKAQKTGQLTAEEIAGFLQDVALMNIEIEPAATERVLQDVYHLAVQYRLTGYDAAYLELAMRKKLPLATLDQDLLRACKAAGVQIWQPTL